MPKKYPWQATSVATLVTWNTLLVGTLLLPGLVSKFDLVRPETAMKSVPHTESSFPYLYQEIYREKSDLDLVVIGTSSVWAGVRADILESELSAALHRPVRVRNFGFNGHGSDLRAMLIDKLTANRRVKMVLTMLPTEHENQEAPHGLAAYYSQFKDFTFFSSGLPFFDQARFFAYAMIATPRQLLDTVSPKPWEPEPDLDRAHGTIVKENGLFGAPFVKTQFEPPVLSADQILYSSQNRDRFQFLQTPMPAFEEHFLKKSAAIALSRGVRFGVIQIPRLTDLPNHRLREKRYWPEFFNADIPMLGIPARELFAGIKRSNVDLFFYDESHLNANGNAFYTRAILPAVAKLLLEGQEEERMAIP